MNSTLPIGIDVLRALFHYDAATGRFTRRIGRRGTAASKPVGSTDQDGYLRVNINGKRYYAHRLAWFYVLGRWPTDGKQIDHINRCRSDNRIANLREVTSCENKQNTSSIRNNSSGFKGVSLHKPTGKWIAHGCVRYKPCRIGGFDTKHEAIAARSRWASENFTHEQPAK